MRQSLVQHVMTEEVVSVQLFTPYREIVETMARRKVGALPVLDPGGRVAGVVSETDLIAKQVIGPDVAPPMWHRLSRAGRRARAKRGLIDARQLMTRPAITVDLGTSLARAAYLMQRHNVRHLPVVDAGHRLLGIVSRGDLLRIFLRPDAEIQEDIRRDVLAGTLELREDALQVIVDRGVATLSGDLDLASTAASAARLAATVPGVVDVVNRLKWTTDDLSPAGAADHRRFAVSGRAHRPARVGRSDSESASER
jgi:CBS domain-containing protein